MAPGELATACPRSVSARISAPLMAASSSTSSNWTTGGRYRLPQVAGPDTADVGLIGPIRLRSALPALRVRSMRLGRMHARFFVGVGAWLLGASAATGGSLLAVSVLGQGLAPAPSQQLTVAAVNRALASEVVEPTRSPTPQP